MSALCRMGLHTDVVQGTGLMGDGLFCLKCGQDKYPEVFSGFAIGVRGATAEDWARINSMRAGKTDG